MLSHNKWASLERKAFSLEIRWQRRDIKEIGKTVNWQKVEEGAADKGKREEVVKSWNVVSRSYRKRKATYNLYYHDIPYTCAESLR